jgi:glyoxylase-like metal-dependent hydrolase (beta-lactamase superfamily II)
VSTPVREERQDAKDDIDEIAPGVRRLQLPINMPGLGHVNCYILDDKNGAALVDPGLPGKAAWQALVAGLKRADLKVADIHTVVVTHSHPDHFGGAGRLQRPAGAKVITHDDFRFFWDSEDDNRDSIDSVDTATENDSLLDDPAMSGRDTGPFGATPWGGERHKLSKRRALGYWMMKHGLARRFVPTANPTHRVADADHLMLADRPFVAIHTPGHTIDHLCLFDPEGGLMIAGDHVLPTITPHISGMGMAKDPLKQYFESLDRMKTFTDAHTVLPAHGHPFSDLTGRVEAIKTHHGERLDVLRDASQSLGAATVGDYMKKLFRERSWGSMAESETFAHLEHLRLIGDAHAVRRDDGMLEYRIG